MIDIVREKPTADVLASLYRDAGWLAAPENFDLERSVQNTTAWILAREQKAVVGMVRLQTDFVRYCCVYDLIVRSDRRGMGIGRKIMNEVLAFCEETQVQVIHLWPTKGNADYYAQFGFEAMAADQPMMVKRRLLLNDAGRNHNATS
jgi:predicted N-acetyltransferase YhbS